MSEIKLPPLPEPYMLVTEAALLPAQTALFCSKQMRDYSQSCQADLVARVQELEAAGKLALSLLEKGDLLCELSAVCELRKVLK